MKKRGITVCLTAIGLMALSLAGSGCSEILSADISGDSVVVLSPGDSLFTTKTSILFWWEENRDIERFHFQLANPDFDAPDELLDTAITGQKLTRLLTEGKNVWRVKGDNEGSETPYITRTLFIDNDDPDKATATALDGDTISASSVDTLRWSSRDQPISGYRYPVADSVFLSLVNDSTRFNEAVFVDYNEPHQWPASDAGSPLTAGKYYWYLITLDKAGNTRKSDLFFFLVK